MKSAEQVFNTLAGTSGLTIEQILANVTPTAIVPDGMLRVGPGLEYETISAGNTAAASGDVVIVHPKTGGYTEDLVTKSGVAIYGVAPGITLNGDLDMSAGGTVSNLTITGTVTGGIVGGPYTAPSNVLRVGPGLEYETAQAAVDAAVAKYLTSGILQTVRPYRGALENITAGALPDGVVIDTSALGYQIPAHGVSVSSRSFVPDMEGTNTIFTATEGNLGYSGRIRFPIPYGARDIRVLFTNEGRYGKPNTNAITVKAHFEHSAWTGKSVGFGYTAEGRTPIYFANGAREITIAGGGQVLSDVIPIDLEPGMVAWVVYYVSVSTIGHVIPGLAHAEDAGDRGLSTYDACAAGNQVDPAHDAIFPGCYANPATPPTYSAMINPVTKNAADADGYMDSYYAPRMLLGRFPRGHRRCLAVVGDSILTMWSQQEDAGCITGVWSSDTLPIAKLFSPSDGSKYWQAAYNEQAYPGRWPYVSGYTHVICNFGRNDIVDSVAKLQLRVQAMARLLGSSGARVFWCTIPPYTTTTDGWTTVANQTQKTANEAAIRMPFNAWLRDATAKPYLAGVIDIAAKVESETLVGDATVWNPESGDPTTVDGVHPSVIGASLMQAAIDEATLWVL